jgi:hypothetical protein
MKTNSALLALGLFTLAGVVTVSCGGSSGSDDSPGSAGTTSTTAGSGTGGSSSGAGTSSTGGADSSTAGTASSTAGTANTGGTNNGTAGTQNNSAGAPDLGAAGAGFGVSSCAAGVMDGGTCMRAQGQINTCQLNDTTYCTCNGRNMPTWTCVDLSDVPGAGGAGPGGFQANCGDAPMNGDDCRGFGSCGTGTCVCLQGSVIGCAP